MRLLITGGCGFLGSHLVEHFLRTTPDVDIVILDKMTYASNGFDRLRHVRAGLPNPDDFTTRVRMLGCDLARPIADGVIQEMGQIDYVIHAAAESHVDRSIDDPLPFLESNVIGTHNLLMMVRRLSGVQNVFVVSTDEVYGPAAAPGSPDAEENGFDEYAPFRPANPYAASKAGAEAVAMAYRNTYKLPITIVNTMNLVGERQHAEKFVPLVIRKVLAGEIVTIHADPTRTQSGTRFYLHCRTFAHALAWLIAREPVAPAKIHVCGEREISNLHLAEIIAEHIGRPLRYELVDFHSSRPGHDLRYAMDDSLIRTLGWVRPMNIEESLRKTVQWYLANPAWLQSPTVPGAIP